MPRLPGIEGVATAQSEVVRRARQKRRPGQSTPSAEIPPKSDDSLAHRVSAYSSWILWNSAAHRVLQENSTNPRTAERGSRSTSSAGKKSMSSCAGHQSRIGRDPIIAVHDLAAMDEGGTAGFHGFRLHLGLLHTPHQALLALQNFAVS